MKTIVGLVCAIAAQVECDVCPKIMKDRIRAFMVREAGSESDLAEIRANLTNLGEQEAREVAFRAVGDLAVPRDPLTWRWVDDAAAVVLRCAPSWERDPGHRDDESATIAAIRASDAQALAAIGAVLIAGAMVDGSGALVCEVRCSAVMRAQILGSVDVRRLLTREPEDVYCLARIAFTCGRGERLRVWDREVSR